MPVEDWSTNPSENASVGGVNIAEGCPAGNINNALRQIMADFASWVAGGQDYQASSAKLTALAGLAGGENQLPIFKNATEMEMLTVTTVTRAFLAAATAEAACNAIGAVRVAGVALALPGYVRFQIGAGFFQVAWGVFTAAGNGYTNVNFVTNFPTAAIAVVSGVGEFSASAQDNNPGTVVTTPTGIQIYNASNPANCYYIAVGY